MARSNALKAAILEPVSNDAADIISYEHPYVAEFVVRGTASYLFHRWSCESVEAKAKAPKGSKAKKTDDLESYVYRDEDGYLAAPGEHFRMSVVSAAKFRQDPRSPRKSACDLYKAGIVVLDECCSFGVKQWDKVDQRRVVIQGNSVTRRRPAMDPGWEVTVRVQVTLPEYIQPATANEVMQYAGRLCGVGDFRPTYGRFQVVSFRTSEI